MAEPAEFSGRAAPGGGPRSALVVGALVVAFLVLAVAKPWDQPKPTPSPSPVASPRLAPTAGDTLPVQPSGTPTPSSFPGLISFTLAPPPPRGATWTSIRWEPLDPSSPLAHLGPSQHWSGGYASLGDDGMGGTVLWTSPDAMAWSPIGSGTATTFWPGMRVEAVAPFGRQLLAVTSTPAITSVPQATPSGDASLPAQRVLATWLSDDGTAWQLHGGPILPNPTRLDGPLLAAGAGDHAVIAWNEVPESGGQATGRLAITDDGASWRPVPASALPSGFTVTDVAAAPGGAFLVAGKTLVDGLGSAALVRSDSTGRLWTPVDLPQDPALAIGERANAVWRLAVGSTGVLAMGDSPSREVWWQSADGRHWTVLTGFDPIGPSGCPGSPPGCGAFPDGVVAGDGERIAAVGGVGEHAILGTWTSPDATRWRRLDAPGSVPRDRPGGIALFPGGIIVTGSADVWYGEAASEP